LSFVIAILPEAKASLAALERRLQQQIVKRIDALKDDPRPPLSRQLKGTDGLFRIRSGDYRIVYRIQNELLTVLIIRIGHRRDAYRNITG